MKYSYNNQIMTTLGLLLRKLSFKSALAVLMVLGSLTIPSSEDFLAGLHLSSQAFADPSMDGGDLELSAKLNAAEEPGIASETKTIVMVLLVVFVVVTLGVWVMSAPGTPAALLSLAQGPSANNLFLGISFRPLPSDESDISEKTSLVSKDESGYLRSLDLKGAVFISPIPLVKESNVRLFLGSLPNFPNHNLVQDGEVTTCKFVGGSSPSFLVSIRFNQVGDSARDPLTYYLESLSKKSSAFAQI